MLIRYSRGPDGKPVKKAVVYTSGEHRIDRGSPVVYTSGEHRIDRGSVDPEAFRIVERLKSFGHDAYIVGGAVRDLLIGRVPKDFDIVTDAQPPRIRHIFRSSRVIGRRFRLVHVYAGPKVYEVSTFRSISMGTIGNVYGTIDEDALRRDFTLNALYYDPVRDQLVDYVGGFRDIRACVIKPVIPLSTIFDEDPVRMLRAAKYSAITGFKLPLMVRWKIRSKAKLLAGASHSRLSEELIKIVGSGRSADIFRALEMLDLLRFFTPSIAAVGSNGRRGELYRDLGELDEHLASGGARDLATLLGFVIRGEVARSQALCDSGDPHEGFRHALNAARAFLEPLCMPRMQLEAAVSGAYEFRDQSPSMHKKRRGRRGGRRHRGGGDHTTINRNAADHGDIGSA